MFYVAGLYCKSKIVRWLCYYAFVYCVCYICILVSSIIRKPQMIVELDVVIGVLGFEVNHYLNDFRIIYIYQFQVIIANASVHDQMTVITNLNLLRNRYFWSKDFFSDYNKKYFKCHVKISTYLHLFHWFVTFVLVIVSYCLAIHPSCTYNKNWPKYLIIIINFAFYLTSASGYYIGNCHENFYAYVTLHASFQMRVLIVYFRQEFKKLQKQINSRNYQASTAKILLRCIKQHQTLTEYCIFVQLI